MSGWTEWLLGLDPIGEAGRAIHAAWRYPLPAWAWALGVLLAAGVAMAAYARLAGPPWARAALGAARFGWVCLIAVLLAGPQLVIPKERVDPDRLLVLVDRSASLRLTDHRREPDGERISRNEALERALARRDELFGPAGFGPHRRYTWLGFDERLRELDPEGLGPADGESTLLSSALEGVLARATGSTAGRVAGVVLFTDGRSPESPDPATRLGFRQAGVPVFPVPLGAADPPLDVAVTRVAAPERAFVHDRVPVEAWVEQRPEKQRVARDAIRVRLTDAESGRVLDEKRLASAKPGEPVRLRADPSGLDAGDRTWRVAARIAESAAHGEPELLAENNRRERSVTLVDRPMRVLYVADRPRWSFRYLRNLLLREKHVAASIWLASADPGFGPEGELEVSELPRDAEGLRPIDVVILGDVAPGSLPEALLDRLRDHVAARGGGLLWVGGDDHVPGAYAGTPLGPLLPMRGPGEVERVPPQAGPVGLARTPLAARFRVLEREEGRSWKQLPRLRWAQALGPLKPGAAALARTSRPVQGAGGPLPLVVRMPYGAGRVVYVATDETWRWRYARGARPFDPFWNQLVQMLARARLERGGRATLRVSHQRVRAGESVVLRLRVADPRLIDAQRKRVPVVLAGPDGGRRARVALTPVTGDEQLPGRTYRALWRAEGAGEITARVATGDLAGLGLSDRLTVVPAGDELGDPRTDHARLAELAEATGGRVVPLHELATLAQAVPNRARRRVADLRLSLAHAPLFLILGLLLAGGEWLGRKLLHLP